MASLMAEKYCVCILINRSRQEVFFHCVEDLRTVFRTMPEELSHWDLRKEEVCCPVMIEEDLSPEEALALIRELQEKSLRNPQGKTILLNRLCGENPL